MGATLQLRDVPWRKYRPWLAELSAGDEERVDYAAFLDRYTVQLRDEYASWQLSLLQVWPRVLVHVHVHVQPRRLT